jgi:hypothetical protein
MTAIVMRRNDPRLRGGDTALTLLLVAASGHPVLTNVAVSPAVFLLMFAWVLLERRGRLGLGFLRRYGVIAAGIVVIFVFHQIQLGLVSLPGSIFFLLKVFIGGLVISHLGARFAEHLFRATFYLCATSLVCYGALLVVGPDAYPNFFSEDLAGPNHKSILVFTVVDNLDWWRNAGMMWEPGAFQGIINLALLLMPTQQLTARRNRWRLVVVVATLLTTFSTTGYITLFLLSAYKLSRFSIPARVKWPAIALLVAASAFATMQADFLGEKIQGQFEEAVQLDDDFSPGRFGALLFDLYYIEKHPLFGNGLNETTRYADHPYLWGVALGHGNGLSNFAATFGLFGLFGYFYAIARSRLPGPVRGRVFVAFIVALLVFGEPFLNYPLFLGLPFLVGRAAAQRRAALHRRDALGVGQAPEPAQPAPQAGA